jgi:hypothetical protein
MDVLEDGAPQAAQDKEAEKASNSGWASYVMKRKRLPASTMRASIQGDCLKWANTSARSIKLKTILKAEQL